MTIIIGSEDRLKVGKVYSDMTDQYAKPHPEQVFKVVRQSNSKEWLKNHLARGGDPKLAQNVLDFISYYYEIQTD